MEAERGEKEKFLTQKYHSKWLRRLRKGQKVEGCSSIELSENGMTYVRFLLVLDEKCFIDNFRNELVDLVGVEWWLRVAGVVYGNESRGMQRVGLGISIKVNFKICF